MASRIKRGAILGIMAALLAFMLAAAGRAEAAQEITVTIPEFKTTINDVEFDNTGAQFPLIVYKDITYFPMTWSFCQQLGLITSWDDQRGLYIAVYHNEGEIVEDPPGSNVKGKRYPASIPTYPIVLNGLKIDNAQEEYPVINFRNITYFPMTWRFAHDELGWDISWSDAEGFGVKSYYNPPLLYVTQLAEGYTLLQSFESLWRNETNADGSVTTYNMGEEIKDYRLEHRTNTLSYIDKSEQADESGWNGPNYYRPGEDVSSQFQCEGGDLLYNGTVIADIAELLTDRAEDLSSYDENARASARCWSFDRLKVMEVKITYSFSIPAPYTPRAYYVFLEQDGVMSRLKDWAPIDPLSDAYMNRRGELYLCSNYRSQGSARWGSYLGVIMRVGADGATERLNDRYDDYNSLRTIGMYDDKLYVLATWFPQATWYHPLSGLGYGNVSALNDGFFALEADGTLTKLHDFVYGDTFLTPDGRLYCIMTWRTGLIDLLSGERIYPVDKP